MLKEEIGRLLKEAQHAELERRSEQRRAFVYPVTIHQRGQPPQLAFSRDISYSGIGLIQAIQLDGGTVADLLIESAGAPVCVTAEVRWSKTYGEGWHLVGWRFQRLSSLDMVAQSGS